MNKLLLVVGGFCLLASTACNSNETKPEETTAKDSMAVTTAPVTNQADNVATDTLSKATSPETPANATPAADVSTTTENYESSTGQAVKAVYNNAEQVSFVTLTVDGKDFKLTQTEAWAKGAEYSNGKIKWTSKGDEATLNMDGKVTKFTVKK